MKKQARPVQWILATLSAVLLLAGCSSSPAAPVDVDPQQAANTILDSVEFRDTLVEADAGVAESQYRLDDSIESYSIWISGSGGTAEEIAVLKTSASASTEDARAILNKRIDELKFRFENYVPKEMVKLQDPVIVENGNIIILILADDATAAKKSAESILGL